MNKQQLQWKFNRLVRQLQSKIDSFQNLWRGAQSKTRMCPACRALIGISETTCPLCGERLRHRASGIGKLLQNILPNYMPLSFALLTVNFVYFVLIFAAERDLSFQDLSRIAWGVSSPALARWGADVALLVYEGQWWRLVSAIFIHIGIIHLFFNSYALLFIGPLLEEHLGRERFFVLYLASGAFGFLLSNWYYNPRMTTAGASGAIFGLIGAALVLSNRWSVWGSLMHQQLVHWAIYGFGYGLFIGANNAAHVGGFVAGAAIAFVIPNPSRGQASEAAATVWRILYWFCLGVTGLSLFLAVRFRLSL
jgi:rhomboid protease GluP